MSGQTYYVVNDVNNVFQLAPTPGGTPLALGVSDMTEGTDTLGVEGLVLSSAGTGTQDLLFPLNPKGASVGGTYQLIGVGGAAGLLPTAAALLAAAPGNGEANAGAISSGGGFVNVIGRMRPSTMIRPSIQILVVIRASRPRATSRSNLRRISIQPPIAPTVAAALSGLARLM